MTKTGLSLTVVAADPGREAFWVAELKAALSGFDGVEIAGGRDGDLLFVDAALPGLDGVLEGLDRRGKAVFLIVRDGREGGGVGGGALPEALRLGAVDDVLVHPFRPVEVHSKLRHYRQILMWDEVTRLNASFAELVAGLQDDLQLAGRLQKGRLPSRFPEVRGFRVASRYLAGMRSGGDHFDLADSKDGGQLSIVLSDSSSYGLSSAVLSALVRVTLKLTAEQTASCVETVRKIRDELVATLREKDRLSLFYGVLTRKDLSLRYLNLGTSCAFVSSAGGAFRELAHQGGPITQADGLSGATEGRITLQPSDRLVLVSDGFLDAAGGASAAAKLLDEFRAKEPADLLNELVYRVKKAFTEEDEMPAQDCTAVLFDVDSRVLRLTPGPGASSS
jgi:hypothetical protein